MRTVNLVAQFKYDRSRFHEAEVAFHLKRAIDEYFSRLFDDDEEDAIKLIEVWNDDLGAKANRLSGGNS